MKRSSNLDLPGQNDTAEEVTVHGNGAADLNLRHYQQSGCLHFWPRPSLHFWPRPSHTSQPATALIQKIGRLPGAVEIGANSLPSQFWKHWLEDQVAWEGSQKSHGRWYTARRPVSLARRLQSSTARDGSDKKEMKAPGLWAVESS